MASGQTGATNIDSVIRDFVATASGTYYIQVGSSSSQPTYHLMAIRNADFDLEGNDTTATAQAILSNLDAGQQRVLGAIGNTSSVLDVDKGAWNSSGSHTSTDKNYTLGSSGGIFRDYVVFSLSGIAQPIIGASLVYFNPTSGYSSSNLTDTLGIFDVSTPIATLEASGSSQTAIYDDLGTGVSYGQRTVSTADNNANVTVPLNSAGVSYLNSKLNSSVAFGGSITTLVGQSAHLFSGTANFGVMLVLQFAVPDVYKITVAAGQALQLATSTPNGGTGEPNNAFDPKLRLLDSNGVQLAADDNGAADGRNALINYTATSAGTYYVEVSSALGTFGDYVLTVGNPVAPPAFQVATITPANGALVKFATNTIRVDFNQGVYLPSLTASDLLVDGVSVATGLTQIDSDSFTFILPGIGLSQGAHTLSLAAGSVTNLQQTPLSAFTSTVTMSIVGPRVVATSLAPGAATLPGSLSYQITFDKAVKVANLTADDFSLRESAGRELFAS